MKQKELTELTDMELLKESQKQKSTTIVNAVLIGFLAGIIIYSIWKNSLGFLTLVPLFLIYKLANKSAYDKKEIDRLLVERKLK